MSLVMSVLALGAACAAGAGMSAGESSVRPGHALAASVSPSRVARHHPRVRLRRTVRAGASFRIIASGLPRRARGRLTFAGQTIRVHTNPRGGIVRRLHVPANATGTLRGRLTVRRVHLVFRVRVRVPATAPSPVTAPTASPAPSAPDPVVVAAGDVACPSATPGTTTCGQKYTGDLIRSINPSFVLGLGDYQYDTGTLANFAAYYEPFWGSFKDRTRAINGGSHDFYGGGDYYTYFGASAGPAPYASYSFDVGGWHLIALNDYCSDGNVGGCGVGSRWYTWLQQDLAAHPNTCTLAYWHQPYWTSGATHAPYSGVQDYIQLLYDAGVDVLLQAHNHQYERFAPQDPHGQRDDARGIEAFVVGTGGRSFYGFNSTPAPNSLVRNADTFGVLKLTLHSTSVDYSFQPIAGETFTDSGNRTCH
jgi:hypothetical protein